VANGISDSLRRARTEPSAFADVYAAQARGVLVYFARRTFDVEAARDLTAETFAQAFEHRRRYRGSSDEEAVGWLYGIARNQLGHYARRGVVARKSVQRLGIRMPEVAEDDYERIVSSPGWRTCASASRSRSTTSHPTSATRCAWGTTSTSRSVAGSARATRSTAGPRRSPTTS
jgi:DNA-directed RNA polymerase specialized sigma24 family protein